MTFNSPISSVSELINEPFQLTREEKDQLFLDLLDQLDLQAMRCDGRVLIQTQEH